MNIVVYFDLISHTVMLPQILTDWIHLPLKTVPNKSPIYSCLSYNREWLRSLLLHFLNIGIKKISEIIQM